MGNYNQNKIYIFITFYKFYATAFKGIIKTDRMYVANASGEGFPDSLVASALAGKYNSPLILLDTEGSPDTSNAISYIKDNKSNNTNVSVIGGTGVVSDATFNRIKSAISTVAFNEEITSVETVINQVVDIRTSNQALRFTVNGGKYVPIESIVSAGYSLTFVTDSPVFSYDTSTDKSQTSKNGILDNTALTYFYYGSTANTSTVLKDNFKYQVQVYKGGALVASSDLTRVDIIDRNTTAALITDYTIRFLRRDTTGGYVPINSGDRTAATTSSNLSTKVTSGKLVEGEKASVSEVKGALINGETKVIVKNLKFYSSNPFVATVDENSGIITANSSGNFNLTIKSGDTHKDIPMVVVRESRIVSSVSASVSSIRLGKNANIMVYIRSLDQYGDDIQGTVIVPTVSNSTVTNTETTKDTEYAVRYVKNQNGERIAYERVVAQPNIDGKAIIEVINNANTPNTGEGVLNIVNNRGATLLSIPLTVTPSVVVSSTKLEAAKDGESENLTLDLNPQGAKEKSDRYVRLTLNKYSADGVSLGTVTSNSEDFGKYKFYITQNINNKIFDDSKATDKSLIPIDINPEGSIIVTTAYGVINEGFTGAFTSTIIPSNRVENNRNIITVPHTGKSNIIARAYDPVSKTEGQILSNINIKVEDTSPTITAVTFQSNIEGKPSLQSKITNVVNISLRDIVKEENIKINNLNGDGIVRIANNGAIFIRYEDGIPGAIKNIRSGEPAYNPSADILLGYIVTAPSSSDVVYAVVNADGTISAKLARGKTTGKIVIGVRRAHEDVPFTTTTANISK